MTPELRDRLIAFFECRHCSCPYDDCAECIEAAACLQELRALQSMPYLELDENTD